MRSVYLRRCVNVSVANLMVDIVDAQLNKVADIGFCERRNQILQNTEVIFCPIQEVSDFQGIPVHKISPAANKAAGFIRMFHGFNRSSIDFQIVNTEPVNYHHNINITVIRCFPTKIAALQADIHEPCSETHLQQVCKLTNIFINMDHVILPSLNK